MKTIQLEVTGFCNEKCRHCYHSENRNSTEIENLFLLEKMLVEFGELGFISITITGGEPLLHPGFREICTLSQKNRYVISVKTNGTLIDDGMVKFFKELKPLDVVVSIYSADKIEHDYITQIPGSFERSMTGIRKLKNAGVKCSVMTPVLKGVTGWKELFLLTKQMGIPWSCSPHIHSSFDERPEIEQFKGSVESHREFIEFIDKHENRIIQNTENFCFQECQGGDSVICIGTDFSIRACVSFPEKAGVYTGGNASLLLSESRKQLKQRFSLLNCADCKLLKFCSPCPAKIKVTEHGSECDTSRKNYAIALKT